MRAAVPGAATIEVRIIRSAAKNQRGLCNIGYRKSGARTTLLTTATTTRTIDDNQKKILEINPNHSLMNYMSKIFKSNPNEFDDLSKIVLDQARLLEGHLPSDVSFYCKKINELITKNS